MKSSRQSSNTLGMLFFVAKFIDIDYFKFYIYRLLRAAISPSLLLK